MKKVLLVAALLTATSALGQYPTRKCEAGIKVE